MNTMEQEIQKVLDAQNQKLDAILISTEKTRKYFLIIIWVTVATVVIPGIGLLFAIPSFINSYSASLEVLL